jgi:hypothetical protein
MLIIVQFVKKFLAIRLITVFTWIDTGPPPDAYETSIHPYQTFLQVHLYIIM